MSDKRKFSRVPLRVHGTLSHGDKQVDVIITDVSLQGIKLSANEQHLNALPFDSHDAYVAEFKVNEDSPPIVMYIEQLYRQTDSREDMINLGCKVSTMSVESISALRRLIVLNSNDADLNDKELNALIDAVYSNASSASES